MKKICLLLAMLLCLVPVLSACGGAGGAEKAVKKYLDARFVDFDKDAAFASTITWNKEVLKELLDEDDFDAVAHDEFTVGDYTYDGWRDYLEEDIKEEKDFAGDADEYEFNYDVYASRIIENGSDEFDAIMEDISFGAKVTVMENGTEYDTLEELKFKDTDLEGLIEEMAIVRVVGEQIYTKGDEDRIETFAGSFLVLNIDGDWLVYGSYSYDSHYEDEEDQDLSTWLD